ncbi:MAG TPA: phosphodiester glycosidase family protein [Propionicimonas sp.]
MASSVQGDTVHGPRVGRRVLLGIALTVATVMVWLASDLGPILVAPSQDSLMARTAEWARMRGLGGLVTELERVQYQLNPPPTGGTPDSGIPQAGRPAESAQSSSRVAACGRQPMPSPARAPLANEGVWQTIETVRGQPAILATFVRPDAKHTRFLAGITCINQDLASFVLHPGTQVPGGTGWSQPTTVPQGQRGSLLATFNSGFLMADAMGGFWQDGNAVGHLTAGRASMVFLRDGHLDIRSWEGGPVPAGVAAVRQNLTLLVDNGQITDAVRTADSGAFGKTLGDTTFVWRSGVGIRADGSIVTVHGNALSVQTLAQLLLDAGAVRAMQLDINRDWTSYIYYRHSPGFAPVKLTADQVRPAGRYLHTSSRDFVAVAARR